MNVIDLGIALILFIGLYKGWKRGAFRSLISLIGTIAIIVLAYIIKNPISALLYTKMPFLSFSGLFKGISSFNIIFYEGIAYIICLILLFTILKIIIKVTGIIDKIINLTIVLALPSKILGAIFKCLEYYLFIFVITLILGSIPITSKYYNTSKIAPKILSNTPAISSITDKLHNSIDEIYDVIILEDNFNKDYDSLDILLKYDIISIDNVKKIKNKLKIENIDSLIEKYEVKKND